jgi:hypothetical protein
VSTDLAIHNGTGGLAEKIEFARALAGASLIPRAFQEQPANILVAMELGEALNIASIVAINEINVINGAPSLSASLMAALARQAGHKVRITGDDHEATCTIIRADDPDFEHTATWDEAKARKGGLWGKGHWAKDPGTMLRWRAISECVRFACSEVLGGIKYTPDELEASSVTVTQVPTEKVPRIADVVAAADPEPAEPKLRSEAQSKKLAILLRELGMNDRAEALAYISGVVGREVESTKTLTVHEASTLIDNLEKAKTDSANRATGEVVDAELVEPETEGWPEVAKVPQ